LVQLFLHYL